MVLRPGKVGTLLYSILCMRDSTRVVYKSSQNGGGKNDSSGFENFVAGLGCVVNLLFMLKLRSR